jgi:hypothetical protein
MKEYMPEFLHNRVLSSDHTHECLVIVFEKKKTRKKVIKRPLSHLSQQEKKSRKSEDGKIEEQIENIRPYRKVIFLLNTLLLSSDMINFPTLNANYI